jgi:2,3-bisphosphoglycerate-dependent phosphoglycerate mutase
MTQLALCRHGQSEWNLQNRFTGWVDVNLTEKGEKEARLGGELLAAEGLVFDEAYTSYLKRAIRTLWIGLEGLDQCYIPVTKDWRLNERHYGGLSGLDKQEMRDKYGDEQVHIWRRSFDTPPPIIGPEHEYHPANDPRYCGLDPKDLPGGESLKLTLDRVIPYFDAEIAPKIKAGRTILISAHGNSLRALLKHLFHVSDDDISGYAFPTGNPLLLDLETGTLKVNSARYLDESRAKKLPPLD